MNAPETCTANQALIELRKELDALPITEVVNSLLKMDVQTKRDLVSIRTGKGSLLAEVLVDNCLFGQFLDFSLSSMSRENEQPLIEALTILESVDSKLYDNKHPLAINLLDLAVSNLLIIKNNRSCFGDLALAHIASKVSDVDRYRVENNDASVIGRYHGVTGRLTNLMLAVIAGDVGIVNTLIAQGADLDLKNELGYDCYYFAEVTANNNPEFYRDFIALMIVCDQKESLRTKERRLL